MNILEIIAALDGNGLVVTEGDEHIAGAIERLGYDPEDELTLATEQEQHRMEALLTASADATDAIRRLYDHFYDDGAAVGEILYECDKAARRSYQRDEA